MVSCDTRISGSSGYSSDGQPAICSGDQRSSSFSSTTARNRRQRASFSIFGRRIRRNAARSARHAR
jgi:hypothetical protein